MKTLSIGLLALLFSSVTAFAGSREELQARMGFSKEEIAKDAAAHNALTQKLDATGGKTDPKAAASGILESNESNALRASHARRQHAESLVVEADKRAALAKISQQEAEGKAEVAVRVTQNMLFNNGISAPTYSQALDGREKFVHAAQEARAFAEDATRKAEQARVLADAIIAKANADETMLEQKRLARAQKPTK
jgi:hypothetical protein